MALLIRIQIRKGGKNMEDDFDVFTGVYAVPPPKSQLKYDIASLFEYSKEKGVEPSDLSPEEKMMFLLK
jgi:hypothetical protein